MDERIIIERASAEAVDNILGVAFPVLDDGFVRVIDYMGCDRSIVQAARISYGAGTKHTSQDRALIRYLMRHRHTTPFEMCEIKLHVRVPMDCWRQWIRHRTANVNEYSTRYSEVIDASAATLSDHWRGPSAVNKQGSGGYLDAELGRRLSVEERELQDHARRVYADRLRQGVAREQARKDLPLSTYTEAYWKIDLHNLLRFISLRMDERAQEEIRQYATVIGREIVGVWCPLAWEAFLDYEFNAATFSRLELDILRKLHANRRDEALELARSFGWLESGPDGLKRNGEREEFKEKLIGLGMEVFWE